MSLKQRLVALERLETNGGCRTCRKCPSFTILTPDDPAVANHGICPTCGRDATFLIVVPRDVWMAV